MDFRLGFCRFLVNTEICISAQAWINTEHTILLEINSVVVSEFCVCVCVCGADKWLELLSFFSSQWANKCVYGKFVSSAKRFAFCWISPVSLPFYPFHSLYIRRSNWNSLIISLVRLLLGFHRKLRIENIPNTRISVQSEMNPVRSALRASKKDRVR